MRIYSIIKFCISVAYDKNLIYSNEKCVCQIDLEIQENNLFSNNLPVACLRQNISNSYKNFQLEITLMRNFSTLNNLGPELSSTRKIIEDDQVP